MNAAASAAARKTKKLMKFGLSLFRRNFNSSKCKTAAKMAVARIKLLKNKREVVVRQMRRDIALLLQSKQDSTARIRVEHVIREQNVLTANEFVELFCELIVSRLSIIAKQRECPADLKEGIASVIFAAPRCSEIPELLALKDIFEKKYGRDFVSAATDLRPNAGVNRMLIEKLSVRTPTGQVKLKVMKEIAKEYQIDWDTTESEAELLKPPEERIDGPQTFFSATSLPVKHDPVQPVQEPIKPSTRSTNDRDIRDSHFENTASAAEAAAESAKKAIAAAQAAAYLANRDSSLSTPPSQFDESSKPSNANNNHQYRAQERMFGSESYNSLNDEIKGAYKRHSYNADSDIKFESESYNDSNDNNTPFRIEGEERGIYRRHSYNAASDIKFDESDCDEEIEADNYHPPGRFSLPPRRPPPTVPSIATAKQESFHRVHPKLPDYEDLAARFEALKYRKS